MIYLPNVLNPPHTGELLREYSFEYPREVDRDKWNYHTITFTRLNGLRKSDHPVGRRAFYGKENRKYDYI